LKRSVDYDLSQDLTFGNQIDSENHEESALDSSNYTNGKDTTTFGDLNEFEERLGLEDEYSFLPSIDGREQFKDTFSFSNLPFLPNTSSLNIPNPIMNLGEE